jgi:hypothetical protein
MLEDVVAEAEKISGDSCEHVDGDHAERAEERFAEETEVPEAPHIGGDVDQTDVDEGGGEQTVPLTMKDEECVRGAEVYELVGCGIAWGDAVEDHPNEDSAVDSDEDISSWS